MKISLASFSTLLTLLTLETFLMSDEEYLDKMTNKAVATLAKTLVLAGLAVGIGITFVKLFY